MKSWINYVNQNIIIIKDEEEYKEFLKYRKQNNCEYLGYKWLLETNDLNISYGVTHLIFGENFNQPIEKGVLPDSLTNITFSFWMTFNQPIKKGVLPKYLTHLIFGNWSKFNQPIGEGVLPDSLTHLTFGNYFNQPIGEGVLPNSLTHLTFGRCFNQPIEKNVLPKNLTQLTFYNNFFKPLRKDVPDTLKEIVFNRYSKIYNNERASIILGKYSIG